MLVAGNVLPVLGVLFYPGIFLASALILKGYIRRINIYSLVAPYFLMLGFCIWNNIFPYYLGIILAVLLGELIGRILYNILLGFREKSYNFTVFPVFLFVYDFVFQNIPAISFIHMIPVLSPLSPHGFIVNGASVFGEHVVLLLTALLMSSAAKIIIDLSSFKTSGTVLLICSLVLLFPNLSVLSDGAEAQRDVSVASIQGSYKPSAANLDYEEYLEDKFNYYMSLTEGLDVDITVFPETVLGVYDTANKVDKIYRKNLADASEKLGGITVLTYTEGNSVTKSKEERYISALLVEKGEIIGISRKRNLVPFSETKNYSEGKSYDVHETSIGKIGISICYDINGKTVEKLKNNGAQIILAPFNDSGFGSIYHNIHRYYPVIKAAECAVPIVVANEDGISQIIDHDGRILAELGYGEKGRIIWTIGIKDQVSIYLLFGRYLEWVLFLSISLLTIAIRAYIINMHWKYII